MGKEKIEIKPNAVYSVKEIHEITGLGTTQIYEQLRNGEIKARKFGTTYRVLGKNLLDRLEVEHEN